MAVLRSSASLHPVRKALKLLPILAALIALWPSAAFAGAGCDDDFSAPALASSWTFFDADGETGGAARITTAGKLELAGKGSDVFNAVNEFVGVKRAAAAGDFDVSVKIESQSNTNGWAQAGILAANDAADLSKGGYVIVDVTPGNGFHAFYDAAGSVGTLDKHADVGSSAYPVWIRLVRSGMKFSAWYKLQAQNPWLPIAENFATQGTGSASQVALVSLSHNDSAEAKTVFDDFTCQGGATGLSGPMRRTDAPGAFFAGGFDATGRFHVRARNPARFRDPLSPLYPASEKP